MVKKLATSSPVSSPLKRKHPSNSVDNTDGSENGKKVVDVEDSRPVVCPERQDPFRKELREGDPGTPTGRPLRLYADGIFDMFHIGHARMLEQCKKAFPNVHLLVGCCSDELTNANKGRTVMRDYERYDALRHCKWVDEVVTEAPWVLNDEFLDKHEIDYVCHDALPYADASGDAGEDGDVYARIRRMGKFLETKRTPGISTTGLITRIIREYDIYVKRNFDRGMTAGQMNVPFVKEQSVRLDMAMDRVWANVDMGLDQLSHTTESLVARVQDGFSSLFDTRHPVGSVLSGVYNHFSPRRSSLGNGAAADDDDDEEEEEDDDNEDDAGPAPKRANVSKD